MKPDNDKQDLPENLATISDLLDRSVEQIDQDTLTALSQARAQAVQVARDAGQPARWRGWLWPTGGLATAVAIALAVIMLNNAAVNPGGELGVSEFEILASHDTLEVIEDLEFYQWLSDAAFDEPGETG